MTKRFEVQLLSDGTEEKYEFDTLEDAQVFARFARSLKDDTDGFDMTDWEIQLSDLEESTHPEF